MSGKPRSFDPAQSAAIRMDENVVVSAGAGSGKTTVLVERYARLVEERGLDVDAILALTFTRKAAAEMNSRIHARLAASEHPRAKEQLARFDKARVSTLDSFCGRIARGAAHRYGIPPDFTVDETRLERVADEVAVELLMDRKDDPVLRRLVATMGFDRVRRSLFSRVATDCVSIVRRPDFARNAERQIAELESELKASRAALLSASAAVLEIDEDGGETLEKAKAVLRSLLPFPEGSDDRAVADLAERVSVLAGGGFPRPRSGKKPGLQIFRELIEPIKAEAEKLVDLCGALGLREDIAATGLLLDELARRFLERKRREGVLSFQDGAELATDILKNERGIRTYYKKLLKSILIDEFQDNNSLQKELLYLLAEKETVHSPGIPPAEELSPDKLFFVGDEKQSIYRFRGADVSVFRLLSGELERAAGKPASLSLDANHRSTSELVTFFNAVFPGVFGSADRDFEARFNGVLSLNNEPKPLSTPSVEVHVYESPEPGEEDSEGTDATAAETEAEAAAQRIREGVERGEFSYADVAVLFRSTSRQHEYEKAFRAWGIPHRATDPRGLMTEGPANDLYAVLRLCLFPSDRTAYAAFLRSPFVRLGDDSLARVFLGERMEPFPVDAPASWFVSEADAARFARGAELYRSMRARVDQIGIADLVARLWYDEGYLAALPRSGRSAENVDHFGILHSLALDADRRRIPLSAFLDELAPLMGSYEKIDTEEIPDAGTDAVRLMTVHKSKGLEFPVVIVADAGNSGRGTRNDQPFYIDREFGVAVNFRREDSSRKNRIRNWFFERAKAEEKARDLAELRRLFYVAATRAEKKLFIFGTRKLNAAMRDAIGDREEDERAETILREIKINSAGERADPTSFFDLLALGLATPEGLQATFSAKRIEAPKRRPRDARKKTVPLPREFYDRARTGPRRESPRTVSPTEMEEAAILFGFPAGKPENVRRSPPLPIDTLLFEKKAEDRFGTLCHLVIERALSAPDQRVDAPDEICEPMFPDMSPAERKDTARAAVSLAEGFLRSELGECASASSRRRSEFPFLLSVDSGITAKPFLVNGKMDLIFEDVRSSDRCVIVDFKTDREIAPESHAVQMACYRAAATAFSDRTPESWLFYLREGVSVPMTESMDLRLLAQRTLDERAYGGDR